MSDGFDIAAYLRATGEPEMADEVASMAHRLEAFADGLDCDCMNAQRIAFDSMKQQRDELLSAIKVARECIANDRDSLYETHRNPNTNTVDDAFGLDGLADYDVVLDLIDAAIAKSEAA